MKLEGRKDTAPTGDAEAQPLVSSQRGASAGRIFTRRCALAVGVGCALATTIALILTPALMLTVSPSERVRNAGRTWLMVDAMGGGLILVSVACAIWGPRSKDGWVREGGG